MPKLIILESAAEDILSIRYYISRESGSRSIGRRFADTLRQKCREMAALPGLLGRERPEIGPDIRSFPFKNYVIFFRYHADTFEVVNILEGHRDILAYFHPEE